MLRARVIATTRFPKDSALRFFGKPDFSDWGHRLQVYGLDVPEVFPAEYFLNKSGYSRIFLNSTRHLND